MVLIMNNFYVYYILDPETGQPFYVGKGSGNRANSHLIPSLQNDQIIKECRDKKIISYNSPISEAALFHIFGINITCKEDIPQ